MFKLQVKDISKLMEAAQGKIKNDLLIRGCLVFNVFTKEFEKADVYVYDKFISHVELDLDKKILPSKKIIIENEKILVPGFIDAHTHIESSLLSPEKYAQMVVPYGTTTVIEDAHEIANVLGLEGVEYMLKASEKIPMRQLMSLPSCVPSVPILESSNTEIFANQYEDLFKHERVIGLGEVMDYEGVIAGQTRMLDMLALANKNKAYIQGHSPYMMGNRLSAYLCAGVMSCHESKLEEEIIDKYKKGMWIDIREANTGDHMEKTIRILNKYGYYDRVSFCSDDRRCNITQEKGHLNAMIKKAVSLGMPVEEALLCVTLHPAQETKMQRIGAIAPGYVADMNVIDDIHTLNVEKVFFEGQLVSKKQKAFVVENTDATKKIKAISTINIDKNFSKEELQIRSNKKEVVMNYLSYESFYASTTLLKKDKFKVENGTVTLKGKKKMMFLAVINRYGKKQHTICAVENFGIDKGALASSIGHDCHNISIVFDTVENGWLCLSTVLGMNGGMCAVNEEKVIAKMPLCIAGLMSEKTVMEINQEMDELVQANRILGNTYLENPVSRITIANLLVCPYVKASDVGLILTEEKKIVPIIEGE